MLTGYIPQKIAFNINIEEYIIQPPETPPLPTSVTSAMPNNQTITQGQVLMNQTQMAGGAEASGLTALENALLSEEEKQIRLRSRGIIT